MAANTVQVDSMFSAFATLMRDTVQAWSTAQREAEVAEIQAAASAPVANCAAAALVSNSARTTAAAFKAAAQMNQDNDKNFTEFLRRYSDSTTALAGDHGLRVSSSDYSFTA